MPRAKFWGFTAIIISLFLIGFFIYAVFIINNGDNFYFESSSMSSLNSLTYYVIAAPIALVTIFVIGAGFWIGWTILTIKVVPPMPEIVEKKDYSKIKAFLLCLITLAVAVLFIYGIYLKNFWALAIPSAVISLVILGAIFWVGIAIITARSTLPDEK